MTTAIKNILLIIVLSAPLVSFSQSYRRKITKSVNDTIVHVKIYSIDSLVIFKKEIQYWEDQSEHIFIDGFVYTKNKVEYEYHATEDFLRLIRYEYDSLTGLKEQLVKYTKEELVSIARLDSIEDRQQLMALVESVIPKSSELNNILKPNEAHSLIKKGNKEIYTRLKNTEESVRVLKKYDRRRNLIYLEERNEWQTTITQFKYNKKNQLVKRTHSFDDYKSKTLYFYENLNLIKSISTSKSGYGSRTYFYTDSVLTKEVLSRPEGTIVYEYDYEHF